VDVLDIAVLDKHILQYQNDLSRLCISLCRNITDADDLYQDTWMKVVRFSDKYDETKPFDTSLTGGSFKTFNLANSSTDIQLIAYELNFTITNATTITINSNYMLSNNNAGVVAKKEAITSAVSTDFINIVKIIGKR
jgi:hypothetical protein